MITIAPGGKSKCLKFMFLFVKFVQKFNFDFTRKIWVRNSWKCWGFWRNWIFRQKIDFLNSVPSTLCHWQQDLAYSQGQRLSPDLPEDIYHLIKKASQTQSFLFCFDFWSVKKLCSAHARGSVCKVWIELRVYLSKIQLIRILKSLGPLHSFFVL